MAASAPADRFVLISNHFRRRHRPWRPGNSNLEHVNLSTPRRLMQACWNTLGWPPIEAFTGRIDLFHGTHFVLPAVRSAKLVLTVHDLTFLKYPEYFSDRRLNERGHQVELANALKRADAVIAPSDCTRRDLIELMRVPEDRIRVIHEGVEEHFFVSEDSSKLSGVLTRYGLTHSYMVFLVGTPEPRKNLARTVAAARIAAPSVPLVVVGPREPIRSLLKDDTRGLRLIGSVPEEDLPFVLQGAVLALYPSLAEGFGLPAVEALAAGAPLVTSDRTALPEVVGKAAVLVNPESVDAMVDAIRNLINDEHRRRHLIDLGKIRAREMSWECAAGRVLALYRELVPCTFGQ
jgi:glycosyltransferase involved in cell wall biosynthesis